jgi:hypothetical protein
LTPQPQLGRKRKLDWKALERHIQEYPDALWFNQWLEEHLVPELKPNSTLILDNAPFHRKDDIFRIATEADHKVLFLPPNFT